MSRNILSNTCLAAMLFLLAGFPAVAQYHSADTLPNQQISLSELLRVIQFFNSGGFHCLAGTEDGYAPGPDPAQQSCVPHDSDYSPQDWLISLSELLRIIQFFNSNGYHTECGSEDNFAPGPGSLFECGGEGEGSLEGGGEGGIEGEGTVEGQVEGQTEGIIEGEGAVEGEGVVEGQTEGGMEGQEEGIVEGEGTAEGQEEGLLEGQEEGASEGEGVAEGQIEGLIEGQEEGEIEGEGVIEGQEEGASEGEGAAEGEGAIEGEGATEGSVEGQSEGEGEEVLPDADFTAQPLSGPVSLNVFFTDTSSPGSATITSWLWNFGDGDLSTNPNPNHIYDTVGRYTVSLTVTTDVGSDTETKTDYIYVYVLPTAAFSATPLSGPPPLTVQFTDESGPGSEPITNRWWNSSDGHTSSEQNPTFIFEHPGYYTVSLSVYTAAGGDTETKMDYITVGTPIDSIEELQLIGNDPGYPLDGAYFLSQDLDASDTENWNLGAGFDPLGTESKSHKGVPFTGELDGKDYVIQSLTIDRPSENYTGLFSAIGPGGYVHDLWLNAASVTGDSFVGGLAGLLEGGMVKWCSTSPTVWGNNHVGGLVGYVTAAASIEECSTRDFFFKSAGNHKPRLDVNSSGSKISVEPWQIFGENYVGGLVGYVTGEANIFRSYSRYPVVVNHQYGGGLAGFVCDSATVTQCYATGHVSGSMSLGGLIGQLSLGAVQQSCALGSVSGGYNLGGLIATAYQGTVNQCYAAGIVEDEFDSGGLIGTATESSVSGSFWDSERSGLAVSAGGTPETTEHMQQQATFATEGWTFWNEDDGIWDISEGETYPWLWDMDHGLIAEFTATPLSGVLPLTVDFTDLSLFCSSPIGSWNWYFGDGLSSDEANPSHTYTTSGVYTVTLTVESEDFWEHAFVKKVGYITVDALPTADFSYDSSVGEVPFTVHFTDTSDPGTRTITSWAWDFGDGDTSTDPNPDHEYTDEGRYTVSLTVTTELGSDTETKEDCIWATGIQIWNISNLGNIGNDPGYPLDGSYTMMDDIDASAKGVFAPIGSSATPFVGTFDGQGYTISGLTINQPSDNYIGLFSYLGDGAYIHDLRMEGGSITGNYYVGALAGGSTNVSITRCFAHTTVSGGITVGGLIGINSGLSVQECSANCTVSAVSARGGGLFGQTTDSTVADSYAEGDVDAGLGVGKVEIGHAGGFVGSASSTSFVNCWASGSVSAPVYAGGFAGSMGTGSTADRCFAGGTVSGNDNVGGFAGYIQQPSQVLTLSKCLALGNVQQLTSKDDKTITGQQGGLAGYSQNALMEDCYAQGAVQGSYYVAGLVGYASRGSFTRCYSTGNITGTLYLGGLVAAIDSCSATDCFWDTESSGQTTSALGTGKTTAEMMTQDTYTNWDFETVWAIDEGFSYPWLQEDGP